MNHRRAFLGSLLAMPFAVRAETLESMERRVFEAINFQRISAYADPLNWDERLCIAARGHSRRMLEGNFFGHVDPLFGDLKARFARAGIGWLHCGENVFRERFHPDPVSLAVVSWMYSAGHRDNILNPDFTLTGIGFAVDRDGFYAVTQQFLTQAM